MSKPRRKRHTTSGASLERLGLVRASRRSSSGWGPFRSVVRERSVEFNLTLDVQNLRQEIEDLLVARELLRSRALVQRHEPTGSLVQTVKTYYQIFRQGFVVPESGRQFAVAEWQQRAFMREVVDPDIDLGNGLVGIETLIEQNRIYATFLRFVSLDLQHFEILVCEDSAVIETKGRLRFEIQLQTILGVFPHVAGNDRILARLIGRVAETPANLTFYFNAKSKLSKYEVDLDLVSTFMALLEDPKDVDALLGRALIANNYMLGIIDDKAEIDRFESLDEPPKPVEAGVDQSGSDTSLDIANIHAENMSNGDDQRLDEAEPDPNAKETPMSLSFILG